MKKILVICNDLSRYDLFVAGIFYRYKLAFRFILVKEAHDVRGKEDAVGYTRLSSLAMHHDSEEIEDYIKTRCPLTEKLEAYSFTKESAEITALI